MCAVEMKNLAWNVTERERLTLYYDSAEELGRLAGFQCFFFRFERGSVQNRVCSLSSFLVEENQKALTRLKRFGSS